MYIYIYIYFHLMHDAPTAETKYFYRETALSHTTTTTKKKEKKKKENLSPNSDRKRMQG